MKVVGDRHPYGPKPPRRSVEDIAKAIEPGRSHSHIEAIGRIGRLVSQSSVISLPDLSGKGHGERMMADALARIPVHFGEGEYLPRSLTHIGNAALADLQRRRDRRNVVEWF